MTKQWIYGMSPEAFAEKLKKRQLFDALLAGSTLLLNILLVYLYLIIYQLLYMLCLKSFLI